MITTKARAIATSTYPCCFCSRHILIAFVGMTLLIVNYGVNTEQMSAVPQGNGGTSSSSRYNFDSNNNILQKILRKNTTNTNSKSNSHLQNIALPPMPTTYKANKNGTTVSNGKSSQLRSDTDLQLGLLTDNFRNARLFGLLGSNFSLSYNLTTSTGTSAANITVVAPAPTYYYAPAPYYNYYDPYGYYNPYAYDPYAYDPYAYSPYAYNPINPYAGYSYYG